MPESDRRPKRRVLRSEEAVDEEGRVRCDAARDDGTGNLEYVTVHGCEIADEACPRTRLHFATDKWRRLETLRTGPVATERLRMTEESDGRQTEHPGHLG